MRYDRIDLGERVRSRRQEIGLSQRQLAEEAELTGVGNAIWRVENGQRRLSEDQVGRLAELLLCTADWLLTGQNPPEAIESPHRRSVPSPKIILRSRVNTKTQITVYADTAAALKETATQAGYTMAETTDVLVNFALKHLEII